MKKGCWNWKVHQRNCNDKICCIRKYVVIFRITSYVISGIIRINGFSISFEVYWRWECFEAYRNNGSHFDWFLYTETDNTGKTFFSVSYISHTVTYITFEYTSTSMPNLGRQQLLFTDYITEQRTNGVLE